MAEYRKSHHPKLHQEKDRYGEEAHHDAARTKRRAEELAATTAYREEFERDYGPDLDEPLDRIESEQEF